MYYNAEGLPQCYKEAAVWSRKAADQIEAQAQCVLGIMHYNAEGLPQSYKEAAVWSRKAADQEEA